MKIECTHKRKIYVQSLKLTFIPKVEYTLPEEVIISCKLLDMEIEGTKVFKKVAKPLVGRQAEITPEDVHHDAREKRLDEMDEDLKPLIDKRKEQEGIAEVIKEAKVTHKPKNATKKQKAKQARKNVKKVAPREIDETEDSEEGTADSEDES